MGCSLNVRCSVLIGSIVGALAAVLLVGIVSCMLMSGSYHAVSTLFFLPSLVESWGCSEHRPGVVRFRILVSPIGYISQERGCSELRH